MKKLFLTLLTISFLTSLQSCLEDECSLTSKYVRLDPVFVTLEDFRKPQLTTSNMSTLENPGKIYFYQNYLLINEKGKGIHFYDLKDPSDPTHEIFYHIDGNFDMSIKDDILVVDNVIDLVTIDISEVTNPIIKTRKENYKDEYLYENQQFISHYETSNVIEEIDCSENGPENAFWNRGGTFWLREGFALSNAFSTSDVSTQSSSSESSNGSGQGGSTARFTTYLDYLYTVSDWDMSVWDFETLEKLSSHNLGLGVETIFPYKDKMFIGSNSGMFVFDLSNPTMPTRISSFSHATACDPVVVQNETAFVTLRTGSGCTGTSNQLDVINISDPSNPFLIKTYPMINPHGLAVLNDRLYICEGQSGFKVLDVSNVDKIKQLELDKNITATDVIALSDQHVMVIGNEGFYFLDVTNAKKIKIISEINVSL